MLEDERVIDGRGAASTFFDWQGSEVSSPDAQSKL
jgi:hypothetical protein